MRTTLIGTRLSSQIPCDSSSQWTTSRLACRSGRQRLPSRAPGTIPRRPHWATWMTWSLASMSVSWSAAICKTSRTWWAICPSGPSHSHSTQAPISSSRFLIYASRYASRVDSATFTWSAFHCSIAIRRRFCTICFASFSTHSTQIGASSCSMCRQMAKTQWLGATLVSSLASRGALSSMCCASDRHHHQVVNWRYQQRRLCQGRLFVFRSFAVVAQFDHPNGRQVSEEDEPLGAPRSRPQLLQAVSPPDHCTHLGEAPGKAAIGHVVGNHVRGGARYRWDQHHVCQATEPVIARGAAGRVHQCVDSHADRHVLHRGHRFEPEQQRRRLDRVHVDRVDVDWRRWHWESHSRPRVGR